VPELSWREREALARALLARFPGKDPLTIRLPDLLRWVPELAGFADTGTKPTPRGLEELQASWYRLYSEKLAAARQHSLESFECR